MKKEANTEAISRMVLAAAFCVVSGLAYGEAVLMPSFSSPSDTGVGKGLGVLAVRAGADWRDVAEKNRKTGLSGLSPAERKRALIGIMQKYADPATGGVGGEPLDDVGEIAEAASTIPFNNIYSWALWHKLFSRDIDVADPVTAAKLLYGFERSIAGVFPLDKAGSEVEFVPQWIVTPFKTGTYRTTLPGGGHFVSTWSNGFREVRWKIATSARKVFCSIPPGGTGFSELKVNGRRESFTRSPRPKGCTFTVVPGADGTVDISLRNWVYWADGALKKKKEHGSRCLAVSFDGNDDPPSLVRRNVKTVKGISGNAAHFSKDSFLEYATDLPGFMGEKSGTLMMWFKHDRTFPSGLWFRDRDRAENFDLQWIDHSGYYYRSLFDSGAEAAVTGGVGLHGTMGGCGIENGWGRRVLGGEWHFIAFTYDAESGKAVWFSDGVVMKEVPFKGGMKFSKTFTLGSGGGKVGLEGAIDEVRFFPEALDEKYLYAEYYKYQPVRYELHDWSVGEGETKLFRFRARNESDRSVKKVLRFSNGESVRLALDPGELKEFTVKVKGEKPGLFKLFLNKGEADARQFECMCLAKPRNDTSSGKTGGTTLIGQYDCTKKYPSDRVALCTSQIVTNGPLVYLESREGRSVAPLAAYRFEIRNPGKPHVVELDYPDDQARSFILGVYPEKWGRIYTVSTDCAGIMTGIDYPLSGKMQTKRLVFWPDSERVTVVVQNFVEFGSIGNVEHPAACAAVRLYEKDGLPPGPVQGMSKDKRTVAVWDEDPTIDSSLTVNSAFVWPKADLEFWRVKWSRIIDYMRWNSQDSWVIKAAAYNGDSTAMDATVPEAALPWNSFVCCNGRCRGWAELGADMLGRAGMGFWLRINHRNTGGWFAKLGGGKGDEEIGFGTSSGGFDRSAPNFLLPVVRNAYKRLIAAYRDKFAKYPGFRGITMNEALPAHFADLNRGYDDTTIGCFTRDTGTEVPAKDMKARFAWLTGDPERLEKWLKWRCEATAAFARELAGTLRATGSDGEVQIWFVHGHYLRGNGGMIKWRDWDARRQFRRAGIDPALLGKIPGVRFMPCVGPDRSRRDNPKKLSDQEYYRDSPSWVKLMREDGVDAVNVFRHCNYEIWPRLAEMGAAAKAWQTPLWLPAGHNLAFSDNFQSYATPHPPAPYTLDSVVSLVADADVQDFLTGWWGLMECGEHDEWRRFYAQFRSVPRGRYALVKGPDDPVAVRSGPKGHYLVNREPYPVKVNYTVDGKNETVRLSRHEIRFVDGRGADGRVETVSFTIPSEARQVHLENLKKLETAAKSAVRDAETLARAAKEARAAFEEGRYHQFRALFRIGAVRRAMHPELYGK